MENDKKAAPTPDTKTKRTVTIACVGDMFLGLNYPSTAPLLPVHDGAHLFDDVKPILQGADIAAGNLEGLLLDKGGTVRGVNKLLINASCINLFFAVLLTPLLRCLPRDGEERLFERCRIGVPNLVADIVE